MPQARSMLSRRSAVFGTLGLAASFVIPRSNRTMAAQSSVFPYELVSVPGVQALDEWRKLKAAGKAAVVIGSDADVQRLAEHFTFDDRTVEAILDAARKLSHPDSLFTARASEVAKHRGDFKYLLDNKLFDKLPDFPKFGSDGRPVLDASGVFASITRDEAIALMNEEWRLNEPAVWPEEFEPMTAELTVAVEVLTRKPLPKVSIAILPTNDWTEIPAFLKWGNWNEVPNHEHLVAAMRSWRDRFGAELMGASGDVMNFRVDRPPATREAALELAREQYLFCNDLVDQGFESIGALAAALLNGTGWYFWWD